MDKLIIFEVAKLITLTLSQSLSLFMFLSLSLSLSLVPASLSLSLSFLPLSLSLSLSLSCLSLELWGGKNSALANCASVPCQDGKRRTLTRNGENGELPFYSPTVAVLLRPLKKIKMTKTVSFTQAKAWLTKSAPVFTAKFTPPPPPPKYAESMKKVLRKSGFTKFPFSETSEANRPRGQS